MVSQKKQTLSTVRRSFRIFRLIRKNNGARVSELAAELDLAPSTVHNYVATLQDEKFLIKDGDEYHLGLKFLDYAMYAKTRKKGYNMCIQSVQSLADDTNERVQFVVEEHGQAVYIKTEATDDEAVKLDRRPGMTRPLHSTSDGKAILAHLPPHRRKKIIDNKELISETKNTITEADELRSELEQIRKDGVAFNDEESVIGLRAVGVPVFSPSGLILGALSIAGPTNRLVNDYYTDELPNQLLTHKNKIELELKYQNQ